MGRVSMATRDELVVAAGVDIAEAVARTGRILDELTSLMGLHRKHAIRLLRSGEPAESSGPRPERRIYDEAVREALVVIWEASDRVCGKRLRPLVPILVEAMERHGHLRAGRRCARAAVDERRDDRSGPARCQGAFGWQDATACTAVGRDAAERHGANLRRLGRSAARLRGGGPGRAQRADGEGQLRADADAVPTSRRAGRSSRRCWCASNAC